MKTAFLLILLVIFPWLAFSQEKPPANCKADVYYFHITHRCNTCISIEAEVRKTLNSDFSEQMADSTIRLFIINCELPENKAISEKYLAYGSTLAITQWYDGKDATDDITGWAFKSIGRPEVFREEFKQKLNQAIQH